MSLLPLLFIAISVVWTLYVITTSVIRFVRNIKQGG